MNYNEVIKEIQNKVKNGEPIHGWMLEMWIDHCMDILDGITEEINNSIQELEGN